jgi:hypothetical protein
MQTAEQPKSTVKNPLISQSEPDIPRSKSPGEPAREIDGWRTHIKDVTSILVTSLPLLGALGTGFVWLAMTFYVGTIEVRPNKAFKSIDVCTYDTKGAEFHFHSPHFQLMPGDYAFLISFDQAPGHLYNAHVNFKETTVVSVTADDDNLQQVSTPKQERQKKWWQFWKR